MSSAYDKAYQATAKVVADRVGIDLQEGVYMGFTGPTYETPAEIRFAETIGADAVGMSTVPEVIIAVHSGLRVLGISAITNHAAGKQAELNHEEVVEVTTRIKETFKTLIKEILEEL
jgi:purine-nucleoside phosphorylase